MEKRGEKRRNGRCTKRGFSNVIRTVRLFFEMQLDSDVKRKFSCEFFSLFFLISLRHLCKIISVEMILDR